MQDRRFKVLQQAQTANIQHFSAICPGEYYYVWHEIRVRVLIIYMVSGQISRAASNVKVVEKFKISEMARLWT